MFECPHLSLSSMQPSQLLLDPLMASVCSARREMHSRWLDPMVGRRTLFFIYPKNYI